MKANLVCLATFFVLSACETKNASAELYQFPQDIPEKVQANSSQTADLRQLSYGISSIVDQASDALVLIRVTQIVEETYYHPFEQLFGSEKDRFSSGRQRYRHEGVGSGFIVDLDQGYVMTNNHVIADAEEIRLRLANNEVYPAKIIGRDPNSDIAILKIEGSDFKREKLKALRLSDERQLKVGEFVLALGAPFGLESSLSFGVISALDRGTLGITAVGNFIQTDAAINPGNSGGPLLNLDAEVIGLNTAIFSATGAHGGVGFAVPASLAKEIGERLINEGEVRRGYLGVSLQELDETLVLGLGLGSDASGVIITNVETRGPAARAGLRTGDVIAGIDGQAMTSLSEVTNKIGMSRPGSNLEINAIRNGQKKNIKARLAEYPELHSALRPQGQSLLAKADDQKDLGLTLATSNSLLQDEFGFESSQGAVVVDVQLDSMAAASGLQVGDVILQVNQQQVRTAEQGTKLITTNKERNLIIRLERARSYLFVGLEVPPGN